MLKSAWVGAVLLLLACGVATARESCPFLRDPAYWAYTPVAPLTRDELVGGELAIGTLNAFRLFDDEQDRHEKDIPTHAEFAARIARIAHYIAHDLGAPGVLAMEEIEDDTALRALVAALKKETGRDYRYVLGEGSAESDIHSALLVDTRYRIVANWSLFRRSPREGKPMHDRLPLMVDVEAGALGKITFVVVHLKSLRGTGSKSDDAPRVIAKRRFQAMEIAQWVREEDDAGIKRLVLLGDFNSTIIDNDIVRSEPMQVLLASQVLDDVAARFLKPTQRWTYRYRCQLNELDHILVSPALAPHVRGYAIARGDTCIRAKEKCDEKRSVSDHEGVVMRLR